MTDTQNAQLPEPGLPSLLLSLASAALAYLGHEVIPGGQKPEVSLPAAKHVIDTIAMLERKTEGNRTEDETRLFEEVLYELRLQYVKAGGGQAETPKSRLIIDPSNPDR